MVGEGGVMCFIMGNAPDVHMCQEGVTSKKYPLTMHRVLES